MRELRRPAARALGEMTAKPFTRPDEVGKLKGQARRRKNSAVAYAAKLSDVSLNPWSSDSRAFVLMESQRLVRRDVVDVMVEQVFGRMADGAARRRPCHGSVPGGPPLDLIPPESGPTSGPDGGRRPLGVRIWGRLAPRTFNDRITMKTRRFQGSFSWQNPSQCHLNLPPSRGPGPGRRPSTSWKKGLAQCPRPRDGLDGSRPAAALVTTRTRITAQAGGSRQWRWGLLPASPTLKLGQPQAMQDSADAAADFEGESSKLSATGAGERAARRGRPRSAAAGEYQTPMREAGSSAGLVSDGATEAARARAPDAAGGPGSAGGGGRSGPGHSGTGLWFH